MFNFAAGIDQSRRQDIVSIDDGGSAEEQKKFAAMRFQLVDGPAHLELIMGAANDLADPAAIGDNPVRGGFDCFVENTFLHAGQAGQDQPDLFLQKRVNVD